MLWKGVFWPVVDTSEDGNIPWITVGFFFDSLSDYKISFHGVNY